MTPFIGSRISWLMVARNTDLASLARSAAATLPPPLPKLVTQSVGIVRLALPSSGNARRTGTVAHGVRVSCYRTALSTIHLFA